MKKIFVLCLGAVAIVCWGGVAHPTDLYQMIEGCRNLYKERKYQQKSHVNDFIGYTGKLKTELQFYKKPVQATAFD